MKKPEEMTLAEKADYKAGEIAAQVANKANVLDVGMWTYPHVHLLRSAGCQVKLVGPSAVAIQPDDEFDVAIGVNFIEDLDRYHAAEILGHMQRVAKKVIILAHEGPSKAQASEWSHHDFEAMGFTVERWPVFNDGRGELFATWLKG